jgi:hypothetical protein
VKISIFFTPFSVDHKSYYDWNPIIARIDGIGEQIEEQHSNGQEQREWDQIAIEVGTTGGRSKYAEFGIHIKMINLRPIVLLHKGGNQ